MSSIEKSIDVHTSARTAYNQWTQFEQFPNFMDGVISVQQMDNKRLHWRTNIGGIEKSFDTEIIEQIPDKRIAWRSLSGAPNAGVVTFHTLTPETIRIMLQDGIPTRRLGGKRRGYAGSNRTSDYRRYGTLQGIHRRSWPSHGCVAGK